MIKQLRLWRRTGEYRKCLICQAETYIPRNALLLGRGKYCSQKCFYISEKGREKTEKWYKVMVGRTPWNKGLKYEDDERVRRSIDAAHAAPKPEPWNKGLRYGKSNWIRLNGKHDYRNMHKRINRRFGKATICINCGELNKKYEWANKSNKYNEFNKDDWMQLCHQCHVALDRRQYAK